MPSPQRFAPNQVYLGGQYTMMNESDGFDSLRTASALITPGTCIEPHDDAGITKLRPVADPTKLHEVLVPIEITGGDTTIDTQYAIGQTVLYHIPLPGYFAWMVIESGQGVIANQEVLMIAAGGKLIKAGASDTVAINRVRWRAEESVNATAADIRCRVRLMV